MGSDEQSYMSQLRRTFKVGDLVTLAPTFRYSITTTTVDFGRYIGIVTHVYSNHEYMVIWTSHPLTAVRTFRQGMFAGDHLIKVENADISLMKG